jgi:hypothetical protein
VEELDFDPDRFVIVGPVWHVADRKSIDPPTDTPGIAVGQMPGGREYVAAFTDRDLAERFIERMQNPDAVLFPVATPADWVNFLNFLSKTGHEYVALDPEPGKRLTIARIGVLIKIVRESLGRRGET